MKKLLLLLTFIGSLLAGAQNTGKIEGKITLEDGMPLSGATVYIKSLDKGTVTDFDGKYTIDDVTAGTYDISFSYV